MPTPDDAQHDFPPALCNERTAQRDTAQRDSEHEARLWTQSLCFALSAILLSLALYFSGGFLHIGALVLVLISFVYCVAAVSTPRLKVSLKPPALCRKNLFVLLQAGVCLQMFLLIAHVPRYLTAPLYLQEFALFRCGMVLTLGLTLCVLTSRFEKSRWPFPLLLLTHFCLGLWILHHNHWPKIDVFAIQRDAANALLHGINPYTITFSGIHPGASIWYAKGLVINGRTSFGYVYPPLSVIMAVPGQLLGDVRYSNLAAITGAGALMAYARPSRFSFLAATLFLFMPQVFYMLALCWTDAFVVLLFAAVLFVACRAPRFSSVPLGLLFAVKQYLFLGAPLAFLLVPLDETNARSQKNVWKLLGMSLLVALVISLPLILPARHEFLRNAVLLNFKNPFRPDSLNFAALWNALTGKPPSSLIGFILIIPTYWLIVRCAPRTPAGYAGATALFYFVFFLFGRQAFLNYYFFIFAALCAAIAVAELDESKIEDLAESVSVSTEGGTAGDLAMMHSKYS